MSYQAPHIIDENGVYYRLGSLKGNEIHYSFESVLQYMEVKGKQLFGNHFRIYPEDHEILSKLIHYMIKDLENCQKHNIDIDKGLLLTGPIGCGKTSLMKLLKFIVPHFRPYSVIPCRNIVFAFNHLGFRTIQDYGDNNYFCFDDLGVERLGKHFGQDCNVMGEILLSRYELMIKHKMRTHATTNLNAQELEERYGNRVRSRMRRLFNLIAFDEKSQDKRQ